MSDVTYVKALAALPAYCLGLMQNLTDDEQKAFAGQLTSISKVANAKVQSMLLGLAIMNAMGDGVLDAAVKSLNGEIKGPTAQPISGNSTPPQVEERNVADNGSQDGT